MRVIAIDFDGVIAEQGKPNRKKIEMINKLFDNKENLIVIHTARNKKIRKETEEMLDELNVKYHCLVMEKLRADYYIDDKNTKLEDLI